MFKTLTALVVLTATLLGCVQKGKKKEKENAHTKEHLRQNLKLSFGQPESLLGARYGVDQKIYLLGWFVYLFY